MIDIRTALQNVLRAVYGKDVRQSIHDAIFQINENANEAIDLAQIKFGNLVTDPTSPIADPTTGDPFRDGVVYFNVLTGIWWKLSGGAWVKLGTTRGISGNAKISTTGLIDTYRTTFTDGTYFDYSVANGAQGVSVTDLTKVRTIGNVDHYDVNLSDGNTTPNGIDVTNGKDGLSIVDVKLLSQVGNVKNYTFERSDGTNTPNSISVEDGVSSYIHVRYSAQFDGTGMVSTPDNTTDYIGICVTNQSAAPTNPTVYNWTKFVGSSGSGTGDMLKSDFATKYPKTTDRAAALFDGTNEILANQLMALAIYASNGNAGVVDKAALLVDLVNGKVADSELLANFSDDGTELKYKGNSIGGKVDIDGASIIENASGQLEVSVDNDTIYIDTANKRIYVKPKFTTGDDINLSSMTAPETVALISSNEAPKTLFNKISTMIKNLRWLLAKYGSADISSLGQGADIGTITGALVDLNAKISSSSGGFFNSALTMHLADRALLGQNYHVTLFSTDESVEKQVIPKTGENTFATEDDEIHLSSLGKYKIYYSDSKGSEYNKIVTLDDFNDLPPIELTLGKILFTKAQTGPTIFARDLTGRTSVSPAIPLSNVGVTAIKDTLVSLDGTAQVAVHISASATGGAGIGTWRIQGVNTTGYKNLIVELSDVYKTGSYSALIAISLMRTYASGDYITPSADSDYAYELTTIPVDKKLEIKDIPEGTYMVVIASRSIASSQAHFTVEQIYLT